MLGEGNIVFQENWAKEDRDSNSPDLSRTATAILQMMNALEPDLCFTMELPTHISDNQIQILDFTLWLGKTEGHRDGDSSWRLFHSFYRKDMVFSYCEL